MRILQLGKFYTPNIGGIETVMNDITEGLNEKNIQCDVLCSNDSFKYQNDYFNSYFIFRTRSLGKYFSTSISPQMVCKLRDMINHYDIIHVHLPDPMANLALFLSCKGEIKIVIHWHSDIVRQKYLLKFYEPLQNWLMSKADAIIATTPKYIDESKFLKKYKDKCCAIPIGINDSKFNKNILMVSKIKNLYKGKKIIFSLGRLAYYKGFKYLIRSARYLDDSYIILIGGTGKIKDKLQSEIDDGNLQKKVKLLGHFKDEELGSYYDACDLYCLPSVAKSEAFGVVQIEAMSFSKPIVATKILGSGVDWVNKDGVTGLNVKIKDPIALSNAFRYILDSNNIYEKFSDNSFERFNNLFTKDKMVNDIINLYKRL